MGQPEASPCHLSTSGHDLSVTPDFPEVSSGVNGPNTLPTAGVSQEPQTRLQTRVFRPGTQSLEDAASPGGKPDHSDISRPHGLPLPAVFIQRLLLLFVFVNPP